MMNISIYSVKTMFLLINAIATAYTSKNSQKINPKLFITPLYGLSITANSVLKQITPIIGYNITSNEPIKTPIPMLTERRTTFTMKKGMYHF